MISDSLLIIQFQSKADKEKAFTQLMQRHQKILYYQIKRMVLEHADADDIAQLVWIKVWEKLDGFKMESEFSTWLFRIGYNETINYLNKQKRNASSSFDDLEPISSHQSSNSKDPLPSQIQIQLEQAIKQLPEKQRFVFILRYYEELNYEKIASITGTTVGGAKANYHQAVKKMQEMLNQH